MDRYESGYDHGYQDATEGCNMVFYRLVVSNAHKFGVDTADSNQLWDFLEKLGLDPYYKY